MRHSSTLFPWLFLRRTICTLNVARGGLNEEWFIMEKDCLSFRDFWLKLSQQMLTYDPCQQMYQGNKNFRTVTKLGGKRKMGKDGTVLEGGEGRGEY